MQQFSLTFHEGHLFATVCDHEWLDDTGAPTSFGRGPLLRIADRDFHLSTNYMGLSATTLSGFVGRSTAGILGADILNKFDLTFDVPNGQISFTESEVEMIGDVIESEEFMGIPIIQATIDGSPRQMFFDSGAQISYFQDDALSTFPAAGKVTDFYPGIGEFQTETYLVDVLIGNGSYILRCGSLSGLLGMTLMMAGVEGIIGNEILQHRVIGFFPRRHRMIFT